MALAPTHEGGLGVDAGWLERPTRAVCNLRERERMYTLICIAYSHAITSQPTVDTTRRNGEELFSEDFTVHTTDEGSLSGQRRLTRALLSSRQGCPHCENNDIHRNEHDKRKSSAIALATSRPRRTLIAQSPALSPNM